LPIVMWHGGGQFGKTFETTPDGREGYESILVRNKYPVYIIDQPRRGRAGKSTVGGTIPNGAPNEANLFNIFRLGRWLPPSAPQFFGNVQFPKDAASIDQYWRQVTANIGPEGGRDFQQVHGVALMDKVGPNILMTHSNSGQYGWRVGMHSDKVKAIIAYEPGSWSVPASNPPPPIATADASVAALNTPDLVPDADFNKLTKIPIQIIYGDNIEFNTPSTIFGVELWRVNTQRARQFVAEINRRGGKAQLLFLPQAGLRGNTHFPFSDLNNLAVADLLLKYLKSSRLDYYPKGKNDHDHDDHDRDDVAWRD
jgi:hypothetical protein